MIDFIVTFGQFIVGCLALGFIVVAVLAFIVEIYDRIKEKNTTDEATKARLKSIKDGES